MPLQKLRLCLNFEHFKNVLNNEKELQVCMCQTVNIILEVDCLH